MKEKVLITGASGFLGYHIIEAALRNNLDVYAAVRKTSEISHLKDLPVSFTYPDFSSKESLKLDIESQQYSYIIHAAGTTKARNQEEYNTVNALYTYNLAVAATETKVPLKKFVFISSLAALGPLQDACDTIDETTTPRPVTSYGKSKLLAEEKISKLSLPLITLRPTAVYGPREKDIFILFKSINKGFEPYIGKHDQRLSFVYAKDVANIAVTSLFSNRTGDYNLSDGHVYTRYELADILKKSLRRKTLKFHLPLAVVKALAVIMENSYKVLKITPALNREKVNELSAANWACAIGKGRTELNFNPLFDLEKGIAETLQWYRQNKWL